MARKLRYYEKKRGNRRTGSKILGSAGEALFFAILLLLGCGGLAALVVFLVVPQWRVNHEFIETTCRIKERQVGQIVGEEGPLCRLVFKIEYQADGKTLHSDWTYDVRDPDSGGRQEKQAVLKRFAVGKQYPCWYDPADPYVVVLVREQNWWIWLVFIIPVSFILIGGGGFLYSVLHWGKSAERRAAIAQRVQEHDLFNSNGRFQRRFPNVPDDSDITNSPGTTLKFRLPIGTSPGWALFGTLLACLFWNGVVSVLVVLALRGYFDGSSLFLTLFIIPFVLVGIALIVFFIRQLLLTTGVGPTLVEISDHPLHPGEQCRLFVSQSGRLRMNSLAVLLVCQEAATYRQGTDTRTEAREVYRQEVFRREGFAVRHGLPFEAQCELAVPAGAMHSFKADHNEVNWKLVVSGNVAGWPDYQRAFQLIIHPANGRTNR